MPTSVGVFLLLICVRNLTRFLGTYIIGIINLYYTYKLYGGGLCKNTEQLE